MECMGGAGLKPHLALHNKPKDRHDLDHNEGQFYLFQGLRVHDSHPMASSMGLGFHFCTYCRAYGTERSKNLHRVCPNVPTKFGRQALARIAKGLRPNLPPKGLGGKVWARPLGCSPAFPNFWLLTSIGVPGGLELRSGTKFGRAVLQCSAPFSPWF